MSINRLLTAALAKALKLTLPQLEDPVLNVTFNPITAAQNRACGQWQSPSLLKIAAGLKLKPLVLAEEICNAIQQTQYPYLKTCFVTGPGFLNFDICDHFLAAHAPIAPRPLQLDKVLIDFGGANIAKPLHVGHIRSFLIGEALRRTYHHCGFDILSDIHLGDWGSQIGIVLTGIQAQYPELPFFQDALPEYPSVCPLTMEELLHLYQVYKHACATEPALKQRAHQYIKLVQEQSHEGITALWRAILMASRQYLQGITTYLDVHFDFWYGESDARALIPALLQQGSKNGVITYDQGALIIKLASGNMVVQKSDGCALYSTTDLATLQGRVQTLQPAEIIYVVDNRQGLYFTQLFESAQLLQLVGDTKLSYAGFGTINDAQNKPFKTRLGQAMPLTTIIAQTVQAFQNQNNRVMAPETNVEAIALSTIKFAILATAREADYKFDFTKFTQAEGKTGMYIMYTAVRIKALTKQLQRLDAVQLGPVQAPFDDEVRHLLLQLNQLTDVLDATIQYKDPAHLANYLYTLCHLFNHFYAAVPIVKETDARRRANYFSLCQTVLAHIELVSHLLGLNLPDAL